MLKKYGFQVAKKKNQLTSYVNKIDFHPSIQDTKAWTLKYCQTHRGTGEAPRHVQGIFALRNLGTK